jgi:hypothetical protein
MISYRFSEAFATSRDRATKYQASSTNPLPKAVGGALASGAFEETGAESAEGI